MQICVTHLGLVFSFSLGCLLKHESFKFDVSIFLVWIMLLVSKNSFPKLRPWRFSPVFPVIVLALPLRSVIHSEVAYTPTPPAQRALKFSVPLAGSCCFLNLPCVVPGWRRVGSPVLRLCVLNLCFSNNVCLQCAPRVLKWELFTIMSHFTVSFGGEDLFSKLFTT